MYSQNNEDTLLLNYFRKWSHGRFLDVGANDGRTLSNTFAFANLGWDGELFEPDRMAFDKLIGNYRIQTGTHIFHNCGLGATSGRFPFHSSGSHLYQKDTGLLSTFHQSSRERWTAERFTLTEAEIRTPSEVWPNGQPKFDLISIDAEGMDLEILQLLDISEVSALVIEYNNDRVISRLMLNHCFHNGNGLELAYKNYENLIFLR